jgi:hypothetical protein
MSPHRRLPISSRHAFALAFDLAFRRDLVHSIVVPMLLQSPWFVALGLLPSLEDSRSRLLQFTLLTALALIGQSVTWLLIASMLRFRARAVFNTPAQRAPGPVLEHYRQGAPRVPTLFVTEVLRNFAFWLAGLFLFLPALYLGFKLSMATETVVLRPVGPLGASKRSFQLTEGRFERWLEMIVLSVVIVLGVWFLGALVYVGIPGPGPDRYAKAVYMIVFAILPVVQYAWTFFYLRLEESEAAGRAGARVVAPAAGVPAAGWRSSAAPHLKLVELERPDDPESSPD